MEVRRLRDKLVLASLVLIVPFVIWNVMQQILRFRDAYLSSIHSNQDMAQHVAVAFTSRVHDLVHIERTVGLSLWGESRIPRSETSEYLTTVVSGFPSISYLSAADANGIIYASNSRTFIGLHQANHPTLRQVMEGADWAMSDVFTHTAGQENVYGTVVGIRKAGKLQGMVLAIMNEEDLTRVLGPDLVSSGLLVITDSKGIVALAHGGRLTQAQRDWSKLPFILRALAGKPDVVQKLRMPDGRVMLGSVEPIRELGWTASVWRCRREVLGPVWRQAYIRAGLVLLLTGLTIGAALWLGNRLSRPVLVLAAAAREFGEGDLGVRADVDTHDEVSFLADSFNEMAATLQERTTQLHVALESEQLQADRANKLYSVAQGLVTTLELKERLQVIANALAEICGAGRSVILLAKANRLEVAAGAGPSFEESCLGTTIEDKKAEIKAILSGEPILVPDASHDQFLSPEFAAELEIGGYLVLPLLSDAKELGLVFLDNPGQSPDFGQQAIETARILAQLAGIAIENAKVFERERNIAHVLQSSLLPKTCDRYGKFAFACRYQAALEEAELGGDFYDLAPLPDGRIAVVMGDVSGKGLDAAVSTAMGKYTVRAVISETPDPGRCLTRVNEALVRMSSEWGFITMFYGLLDPQSGVFSFSNAGHPPPVMVRESGDVVILPMPNGQPPLGAFPAIEYTQGEHCLELGDVLVYYTDGALEAGRNHDPFEIERLTSVTVELRRLAPEAIASGIYDAVAEYSGNVFRDDIALMVAKREEA